MSAMKLFYNWRAIQCRPRVPNLEYMYPKRHILCFYEVHCKILNQLTLGREFLLQTCWQLCNISISISSLFGLWQLSLLWISYFGPSLYSFLHSYVNQELSSVEAAVNWVESVWLSTGVSWILSWICFYYCMNWT